MSRYQPTEPSAPTPDPDRETALNNRIRAIEHDLNRVTAFPSGKDSVTYRSLQGILRYWKSVRDGVLASDFEWLEIPGDGAVALSMAFDIKEDLTKIDELMTEEVTPGRVPPGCDYETVDNSLFLSKESTAALSDFAQQLFDSTSE